MRRTFGLTALLLLAISVLAVAGCTGAANSGVGVLKPFVIPSPPGSGGGGGGPTPTPSISPLPIGRETVVPGPGFAVNNPTRIAFDPDCLDLWYVDGFNLGANNGQLVKFRFDTVDGVSTLDTASPTVFNMQDGVGNPVTLTNPTWVDFGIHPVTGDKFLVVADGYGTANGRVLLIVPAVTTATCGYIGTAVVTDLGALADTPPVNPMGVDFDGTYIFWTEYVATTGRVRRVDMTQTPPVVVDYMTGLNFPAGIESNGNLVVFAQNTGDNYIMGPVEPTTIPTSPADPDVATIVAATGDPVMTRPFDVKWTGNDTFVALDGFGFTEGGGPGSAGAGLGNVRFYTGPGGSPPTNFTIGTVVEGLTDPVGLGIAYDAAADTSMNRVDITYVQAIVTTGQLNRVGFSTVDNTQIVLNTALASDLNVPFHAFANPTVSTDATPEPLPSQLIVWVTEGYNAGAANGLIERFVTDFTP